MKRRPIAEKATAEIKKMQITRVRLHRSPINRPIINQSHHIITVETGAGITGIGEGGTADLINDRAVQLIGKDPAKIEALWQEMYRAMRIPGCIASRVRWSKRPSPPENTSPTRGMAYMNFEGLLIDYPRVSIPNRGGITEYMKLAALCETHCVGLTPHFTGPIAGTALVHCRAVFFGPMLMEMRGDGPLPATYLPKSFDFNDCKLYPNRRPGLGVEFNSAGLKLLIEVTKGAAPLPIFRRPGGRLTN